MQSTLPEYRILLHAYDIEFTEVSPWLIAGEIPVEPIWQMHISLRYSIMLKMLDRLLPIFKTRKWTFKIIRNSLEHFKLNGGGFGYNEVGKVITLYPPSESAIKEYLDILNPIAGSAKGPQVPGAIRLAEVIYLNCRQKPGSVTIPRKFRRSNQIPKSVGFRYIHKEILHTTPKAYIFKSINLKKARFDWCVVKQGHADMAEDPMGRDIRDRLHWEKTVIENLTGFLPVPKVIDFFEKDGDTFLVIEFLDATPLWVRRKEICKGNTWDKMPKENQNRILKYFKSILDIISSLHSLGYVHRDITDGNFLIGQKDDIYIIDFEIAYDLNACHPDPAFVLGTYGFVSPEQMDCKTPTVWEDIYSLGALLLSLITGINPKLLEIPVMNLAADPRILRSICSCMSNDPLERPSLSELKQTLDSILSGKKYLEHEKEFSY